MTAHNTNPKADAYFARAKTWHDEMLRLREIVLDCGLDEDIKWGKPCYTSEGKNIAIFQPFKETCTLMLFKGALLNDPKGILSTQGEQSQSSRVMRFTSVGEVEKSASALKRFLKEAIAVEKAGLKVELKKIEDRPIPEELEQKFKASPKLKKAFEALTPGRQRAYLLHFAGAKQSATRASRIEKCVERILGGKGLMD
jgi:uncharacterized protein YdeI (YjbR/CyaY-like superfamily)